MTRPPIPTVPFYAFRLPQNWWPQMEAVLEDLQDAVDEVESIPGGLVDSVASLSAGLLNALQEGAAGDGTTDDSAAFASLAAGAYAARRTGTGGVEGSEKYGTKTIDIPAGVYRITEIEGLLGNESPSDKVLGLRFKGAGMWQTTILFDPSEDGPLAFNDFWLSLSFEGITFATERAGNDFLHSHTTHNAQHYSFTDCHWTGPWRYGIDLQGDNNNSEFTFIRCRTSDMLDTGAFLHIGDTNTSDQFLNYWFYGFAHWSTSASLIRSYRGGHYHFYGLDCSNFGADAETMSYIFELRNASHAGGVQSLTVDGMRAEGMTAYAGLLYTEWAGGNINIECDWSSQAWQVTYDDIIYIYLANTPGPIFHFHDSSLSGGVLVRYTANEYEYYPIIIFDRCEWTQRLTPSEVVSYYEVGVSDRFNRPTVQFRDCRGENWDQFDEDGVSIWDASVGNRGPLVYERKKRNLRVNGLFGHPMTAKINLPLDALITGFSALSPAGATAEADGLSWTLTTTEGSPTTIATITHAGAASAGYSLSSQLSVPFLCATRDEATVEVTGSNISDEHFEVQVFIEGYW